MIAVIRISGIIKIKQPITETLNRLRLRKKYVCVLVDEKSDQAGMIKKVKDFVAYGPINEATLTKIIAARGKRINKAKIDKPESLAKEILAGKKLKKDLGLKPFFRLHPPRGGLKSSKLHYPKGVLGDNKDDINKLIARML